MPAPLPDYIIGDVHVTCPACSRRFKYHANPHSQRVKCPYRLCRRIFFIQLKLVPATSVPFKPPTPEQVNPTAEPLESDS